MRDAETSRDGFLDGRVVVVQSRGGGHRAGTDAVLLAAALPPDASGTVVDLGAGSGVAGLCAAVLRPQARIVLVDIEPGAVALARQSLELAENAGIRERVAIVEVDVLARERDRIAAGLTPGMASHVLMNPPFYEPGSVRASPNVDRALAHVLSDEGLDGWMRTAASLLAGGGRVTVIWPADRLSALLSAAEGRFGSLALYPLYPREGEAAIRIIASGVKGSRGRTKLLRGMILHESGGGFTSHADQAMRTGVLADSARIFS